MGFLSSEFFGWQHLMRFTLANRIRLSYRKLDQWDKGKEKILELRRKCHKFPPETLQKVILIYKIIEPLKERKTNNSV